MIFLILTILNGIASVAGASELRDLYRGARQMGMGGAIVGLADDEQAVFHNPAAMAGFDRGEMHYLVADLEASTDIYSSITESSEAFKTVSLSSVETLMGKNIYGRAQVSPTLIIPNFGISFIADAQVAFLERNLALPQITFGYQITNGVQFATGFSLMHRKRPKKGAVYPDLRVGLGGKVLWRRGGYRKLPLITLFNLSQGKSLISEYAGEFGMGLGLDLGMQYVHPFSKEISMTFGSSFIDIGDTSFSSTADPIRGNWSLGASVKYQKPAFHAILAYDYRNILEQTDWRQKNHFGIELGLPMISILGGINQVFLTYGAAFDIWILRVTAMSYAAEMGTFVRQDPDRRYGLRLDMKFDL